MIDLSGRRFGSLTVVSFRGVTKHKASRHYRWACECDCGRTVDVDGSYLRSGHTKSCGCMRRALVSQAMTRHGETAGGKESAEFVVWKSMIQRCSDHNSKSFPNYGGRGITVCDRWRKFENFLADMGRRPPGMSIERRDVDGPYAPNNCCWATASEQARNRRDRITVRRCGRDVPLKTACEEVGLSYHTVWQRINRLGWSPDRALGGGRD